MDLNKQPETIAEALALASQWNFKHAARIAELETELAEARKDGERLDALEALIGDNKGGGLLLHHQIGGLVKWSGVGVGLAHRTLRKAIDDFRGAR